MQFNNCQNINKKIIKCKKCNIAPNRGCGFGNIYSEIMFIAMSPGWNPNKNSCEIIPFGLNKAEGNNSGKYLVKLLNHFKIKKSDIYVTNVVKCPTPNNRQPLPNEENNCISFFIKELSIQKPKFIILLGNISKNYFFNNKEKFIQYIKGSCIFNIWHPAYILRSPYKYETWINNLEKQIEKYKGLKNGNKKSRE